MKNFYNFFFILFFIPQITFATVGDEINNLIYDFFGEGQTPEDNYKWEDPINPTPEINIEEVILPESQTELQKEIMFEESSLQSFEDEMRNSQKALKNLDGKLAGQENHLFLLDQQIGFNKQKIQKYQKSEENWKTILERLAQERSILKAEIRWQEDAYQRYMKKRYIRKENFHYDNKDYSMVQWLFSRKTVSEILRERKNEDFVTLQKKSANRRLKLLKKAFEKKEIRIAETYTTISQLKEKLVREKMILENMAERKALALKGLETQKSEITKSYKEAQVKQIESTIYLQDLHLALENKKNNPDIEISEVEKSEIKSEVSDENLEVGNSLLSWPLDGKIKVEAGFHDADYEKEFKKVHEGLDIKATQGTSILAALDGVVEKVEFNGYNYAYVILKHENNLFTVYGHVSKILVKTGQQIEQGQKIALTGGTPGEVGSGYFTSGAHLHFEVFEDGALVNPLRFLP